MNSKHKRAWITGAASGIGRACALELAKQNTDLAISDLLLKLPSLLELQQIIQDKNKNIKVIVVPLDVSNRQENINAVKIIEEKIGGLDIVLFNAGITKSIDIKDFDSTLFEKIMQVNYFGVVYGVEAALRLLRQSACPCIIGMSSIAAFTDIPNNEPYCSSKAALSSFLRILRGDLLPEKIPVTIVYPGLVNTPLLGDDIHTKKIAVTAEYAARCIIHGINNKKKYIYFPLLFVFICRVINIFPRPVSERIISLIRQLLD